MRDLKIMTVIVYFCAAGVVLSFAGGLFAAVRDHQEKSRPQPSVFPTPASDVQAGGSAPSTPSVAPATPGGLPTPAH